MDRLREQIVEVLDETDAVADVWQASGCSITPEVLDALERVFWAMQRLEAELAA